MTRKPKWARRLTAKDLRHIVATNSTGKPSLRALRENVMAQRAEGIECLECLYIANKLGI